MSYFNQKTIWITGASSGIGESVAYELSKKGTKLILSARNTQKLEMVAQQCKLNGAQIYILPLDLSNLDELPEKAQQAIRAFGQVDILINNGGISQRSYSYETPFSVDKKVMDIDYFSYVILSKEVLKDMMTRGRGHIVAVTSISGRFGFPLRSAYCAAKHALYGFFETLRAELVDKNISVTLISPGRINTPISMSAITKDGTPHNVSDDGLRNGMSLDVFTKKMVRAIEMKKIEALIGKKEILMVHIKRFFPRIFYKIVTKVKPT